MMPHQIYSTAVSVHDDSITTCGDDSASLVSTEWYPTATTTASYNFADPAYITPFPSSTMESGPWVPARASLSEYHPYADYSVQPTPQIDVISPPQQDIPHLAGQWRDLCRPRSSPSTFGPSADTIQWTTTAGLGISTYSVAGQPTPVTASFPPAAYINYMNDDQHSQSHYGQSSPPELQQPQPRRPYASIAPNPDGVSRGKRRRDDEVEPRQDGVSTATPKRQRRTASVSTHDLSEENRLMVTLFEQGLQWKDIATRMATELGKQYNVATLQMRHKRLRDKARVWEERDLEALRKAHEHFEKQKWEWISEKMKDFNKDAAPWPAKACARKWSELDGTFTNASAFSSPAPISEPSPSNAHLHDAH